MKDMHLKTERLLLRRWKDSDLQPFADLNADPVVMEHFPKLLTQEESDAMVGRMEARFESESLGFWAAELIETGEFIGFVGLGRPTWDAHFTPCVEVGWRLAKKFWGQGYAPEAAIESLRDGFERLNLDEIVAITATCNQNSIRVMEKIGMTTKPEENFNHPALEDGHHLQVHVLYRLSKDDWQSKRSAGGAKG